MNWVYQAKIAPGDDDTMKKDETAVGKLVKYGVLDGGSGVMTVLMMICGTNKEKFQEQSALRRE